jgi:RNA polymerase sigma factor (sigma-70 family)
MSDVTRILSQIDSGDVTAADQLLPLVYDELRKLAAAKLAQEMPGQTLQATALVHEAYLRLVGGREVSDQKSEVSGEPDATAHSSLTSDLRPLTSAPAWHSRGHFFAAAAEAMRRILVEQARRKQRVRHGGQFERVNLDSSLQLTHEAEQDLVALDEALERLAVEDPDAAAVVKLRYFAGLTIEQTALALNISVRTANRHWAFARAWLYQQLK